MAHVKQTNRRRSSSLCHRHPSAKPTSGFCASCLRERLVTIEAQSSSPAAVQTPELRRIRSYSVRNASAAVSEQPRRRSCDARSNASSLHDLFVDDDEERLDSSIRKPLIEEEEDYYDGEDIKGFDDGKPRKIVEEEEIDNGENKTMKEFIDLDWGNQIKKNNGTDLKEIASVLSRKLKKFSLKDKRRDDESDSRFAGNVIGRHSCDVDPRLSLDGGRISFEKPRASWDGCLIEKTYHKSIPLSTVTEDVKAKFDVEDEEREEKSPGGTVQTKNYYSDSRRRRSFDRSVSIKRQGLLEVDELRGISNAKVSPETVGLFHGAKLLVTEKELRDSNWYSIKNVKPESRELVSKGKICIASGEGKKQDSVELKKPSKKWPKGWNLWGWIQRKNETKNEIRTEQSLKLEGNAVEGSLAESLLKLRRVGKGETNGGVSEKLLKSYSVSARKSCDGVFSGANIVSGFEGGRSSCDGLFHGSVNNVEVGRSSCEGLVNGIQSHQLHQRNTNVGTCTGENLENSLFRFYLTPTRSHKTSKSGKSRLKN
ncbi:Protein OCTOPUS [Cardamine amara subsp. amara]|uniref:Protein OCTOPUS n=1 Tax=Cardamine amara subsp. amara TaxID=228776 RepID=A0ABD1BSN7_CARAN